MLRISSSRFRRNSISWCISFTMASSRLSSVDMSFRLSFLAMASQSFDEHTLCSKWLRGMYDSSCGVAWNGSMFMRHS